MVDSLPPAEAALDEVPPEKSAAAGAALEVGAKLKRTMLSYRLYGRGHERIAGTEEEFLRELNKFFELHGPLRLSVTSNELSYSSKVLVKDEKREEAMVLPLFIDGVEVITLESGLDLEGLRAVLHVWDDAARGGLSSEYSFSTKLWEIDPMGVNIHVRDGFTEDARDRAEALEQGRFDRLVDVLSTQALLEPAMLQSIVVVKTSALSAIAATGPLSAAESMAVAEAEPAPIPPPEEIELSSILQNMREGDRGLGLRTLLSLWSASTIVEDPSHGELVTLAGRIIGSLFEALRFKEVAAALGRISVVGGNDYEFQRDFKELCRVLSQPTNISALLLALENPELSQAAADLLGFVHETAQEQIASALSSASPEARVQLLKVIARFRPSPKDLGLMLERLGESLASELRILAADLGPEHLRAWTRAGLRSERPELRLAVVQRFKTESLEAHRGTVLPLAYDPDPKVRHAATAVFMRARDHGIVPLLVRQVGQTTDLAEQKAALGSLATLKTPDALGGLREIFAHAKDPETRALAAMALALAQDRESIPALEKESKRLLANRSVRAACSEALKRLSIPPATTGAGRTEQDHGE